jgi:hypothetical protein
MIDSNNGWAVEVEDLVKTFGNFTAVDRVSLKVKKERSLVSWAPTARENQRPSACSAESSLPPQAKGV